MLQLSAQSRIFLAVEPVDFRRGIDGLCSICRLHLGQEPMSGNIFVFRNRRATALKILCWDEQGFWLAMKRLARGQFQWWPKNHESTFAMSSRQLQVLLWNGDPEQAAFQPEWRRIQP